MKQSIKEGLSFGLTSAIITTLGLFIGLVSATMNRTIIISGVLTIAIADSLSDALGMHLSQESDKKNSKQKIWRATISTFITKFVIGLTFLIPILMFDLHTAIIVSVVYGLAILSIFSYFIARAREDSPIRTIGEHLIIAVIVIILTHYIGKLISLFC